MTDDSASRRTVLKTTGATLAGLSGVAAATSPALALPPLYVTTRDATDVCSCSATLNGYLEDLGDNTSAWVRFKWGKEGAGLPNTTSWRGRLSTGPFSEEITNLDCTTYEFMAEARASDRNEEDYDNGNVLEFTVSA